MYNAFSLNLGLSNSFQYESRPLQLSVKCHGHPLRPDIQ